MATNLSPVIVALDFPNSTQALTLARQLDPARCRVKVGKELFTRAGPSVVEELQSLNFDVFLDLKFHDIPNTVAGACRSAAELGCWMVNVHASGGKSMLEAAAEAVQNSIHRPLLIAVTILTSIDNDALRALGFGDSTESKTQHLATLAHQAGLDGVVSSAHDVATTKQNFGREFLTVTPGIRPAGSASADQARIATPKGAVDAGADYLVVGRPITQADEPLSALEQILTEINPR
ncbi:MAG: orotidine-5'-phosphate decarboxylase [Pseudomonadota bacterium]